MHSSFQLLLFVSQANWAAGLVTSLKDNSLIPFKYFACYSPLPSPNAPAISASSSWEFACAAVLPVLLKEAGPSRSLLAHCPSYLVMPYHTLSWEGSLSPLPSPFRLSLKPSQRAPLTFPQEPFFLFEKGKPHPMPQTQAKEQSSGMATATKPGI